MEKNEELDNMWDYLGNLESLSCKFEELEDILVILEEGCFESHDLKLFTVNDISPYFQSLLSTIHRCMMLYNSELNENIYNLYSSVKKLKSFSANDSKIIA